MYTNIFPFGERIWVDRDPRGAELSNSTARPMILVCCVFKKVFLVNHGRDILNCS